MSGWSLETPVVLFIYERERTTEQVLKTIVEADPPAMYVVADGPATESEADSCERTRDVVRDRNFDFPVHKAFASENMGLRQRFTTGLDWVFDNTSEAIILEDDTVPEQSFFPFCDRLLDRFRGDERVMEITGRNQLETWQRAGYDYHFSYYGGIWGWATWRDAWEEYDPQMSLWQSPEVKRRIRDLIADEEQYRYLERVYDKTMAGEIETWDYQWGFARHLNGAMSVVPAKNLVKNIGFGDGATNTKDTASGFADKETFELDLPLEHPPYILPDREYDREFHTLRPTASLPRRGVRRLLRLWERHIHH